MGLAQISDVFTPQLQFHNAYEHYFFYEQSRILPLWRTNRYATVSYDFKHKKHAIAVRSQGISAQKFISERYCVAEDDYFNAWESDKVIMDLTSKGLYIDAVMCYIRMLNKGFITNEFSSLPVLIKAVGAVCDLELTGQILGYLIKLGVIEDIYVVNSLLSTLRKCGAGNDAVRMFMKMADRDSVSWNTMISGFHHSGFYLRSLEMFARMFSEYDIYPNRVACLSALSSCASLNSLIHGKEIHAYVIKSELDVDEYVVNGLLDMYIKCSCVKNAELLFESSFEAAKKNTVLWNVMISGFVDNGYFRKAV